MCITKTNSSEKPGGGGASGGMVAHDLVNGWQVTACRDERSEPPETPPPPGAPKDKVTFQCDHPTRVRIFPLGSETFAKKSILSANKFVASKPTAR